jgi:hypothetical protein
MREEEIRTVLDGMDAAVLRDALALFLAEDRDEPLPAEKDTRGFVNFAQALVFLKKNYGFAELGLFSTEADLVYVQAGDRRILLTDLSVPAANRPHADRPLPGGKQQSRPDVPENAGPPSASAGRFSRLEM